MKFEILVKQKSVDSINELPEKTRRILFHSLKNLELNPWPGTGSDKEKLHLENKIEIYRLHIGRSFTALYTIDAKNHLVQVHDIMTIEQAHKKYGRL